MKKVDSQAQRKDRSDIDLSAAKMPAKSNSNLSLNAVTEIYEDFVRAHPDKAEELAARCQELTDRYRPLKSVRVLSTIQAARFTGLSRIRIEHLALEGRIGERVKSRWKFSETELDDYMKFRKRYQEKRPWQPKNS